MTIALSLYVDTRQCKMPNLYFNFTIGKKNRENHQTIECLDIDTW